MAKVKINESEFIAIEDNIAKAREYMNEAENCWGTNFDNLYHNFVESGFLDSLYEDAKSTYHIWKDGLNVVTCIATGGLLGLKAGPIGGIVGLVIGAIFGVVTAVVSDPVWIEDSKNAFKALLDNCRHGNDDSYIQMVNTATKLYNCQLAMENIKTKINEFNKLYANLNDSAVSAGLDATKLNIADADGITLLGVDTEVQVGGKTITMSTSEALNAFYTYTNTVTRGVISADYLERTYGYDVDYKAIVDNANAFITETVDSGLYSHEFVDVLLPSYSPSESEAYDAVTGATNLDIKEIESALNNNEKIAGEVALYAGLLGSAFIGAIGSGSKQDSNSGIISSPSTSTPSTSAPSSPSTSVPSSPTVSTPTTQTPVTDEVVEPEEPEEVEKPTEDEEVVEKPVNEVEFEEIVDSELPESVESEVEVDFDKLAREELEFGQTIEEINERRAEILEDIDEKLIAGDTDSLRAELAEYGYNEAEIDKIMEKALNENDTSLLSKAILEGDQRAQLARKANELAKEAGVTDFDTSYDDRPNYSDLEYDGPSEILSSYAEDKGLVDLNNQVNEAKVVYENLVEETNDLLGDVAEAKADMEAIKEKFTEKYGEDTSMWSEDAAEQYNDAILEYNKSVETATTQMEKLGEAKEKYSNLRTDFDKVKEDFYTKLKAEHDSSSSIIGDIVGGGTDVGGSGSSGDSGESTTVNVSNEALLGALGNIDGNITVGN